MFTALRPFPARTFALAGGGLTLSALVAIGTAGCLPRAPAPTPAPAPAPAPAAPAPAPSVGRELPTPAYEAWIDAPQTPGDWRYAAGEGGAASIARFSGAAPLFAIACMRGGGGARVRLEHLAPTPAAAGAGGGRMTIRTEFDQRTFAAEGTGSRLAIELPAGDPFLEAIAFSKGRFAVEAPGAPPLFLPAWPEISRVIEDCRRGLL